MKKLMAFLAALFVAFALFFLWTARLPPFDGHPEPVELTIDTVEVEHDAVRIVGTAHYPLRVALTRPARLGRPERTWYLFPLFGRGDTMSREIRVMVFTTREPEQLVAFEDLTVEGWALPPGAAMSPAAEDALRLAGYSFADDYVLLEEFEAE